MERISAEEAGYALALAKYLIERANGGHDTCLVPSDMEYAARALFAWVLAAGWPNSIEVPPEAKMM